MTRWVGVTSASIARALGSAPNGAILANGTAALPALAFASDPDTGIYLPAANTFGIASAGKQVGTLAYRFLTTFDNARLTLGTTANITDTTGDTFVATIDTPSVNMTGASSLVAFNMGSQTYTITDTVAKTLTQFELDKMTIAQSGGAVVVSKYQGIRIRWPIPTTGVTITDSFALDFVMPNTPDVTGAVMTYTAINIPTMSASGGTSFRGIYFNNEPNAGSIGAASGVALSIATGARIVAKFNDVGASLNYINFNANNTPMIYAGHASTANLDIILSSKGTGSVYLMSGAGGRNLFRAIDATSAVNYAQTTPAAAGANAKIGASAENLILGTGAAIATTATAGYVLIPSAAGTPTGVPTAGGAGAIAMHYDTSANKIWFYNGSWRGVLVA